MSNANGNTMEITIEWEDRKELGISLIASEESITVSTKSILFKFIDRIHEGFNFLFCETNHTHEEVYETVSNMDEVSLVNLISFGRKNIPTLRGDNLLEDDTEMDVVNINTCCLRAGLIGKLRRGDIAKKLECKIPYSAPLSRFTIDIENNFLVYDDQTIGKIYNLLTCETMYPMKLSIEHKPLDESIIKREMLLHTDKLDLSENIHVQSGNWNRLTSRLNQLHALKTLDLSKNNVGRDACVALVSLLNTDDSSLKCLTLNHNQIDDECVSIICNGLKNNKTLIELHLDFNDGITQTGWKFLVNLMCNKTDMNSTYNSNHTLVDMSGLSQFNTRRSPELRPIFWDLHNNLVINKNKGRDAGRCKLWKTYFKGGVFDLQQFIDMDVQIIPRILAWLSRGPSFWLSRGPDNEDFTCLAVLYHFIRNWDVPLLFGFPSAESLRIGKRVDELEKLVKSLRMENLELREEIRVEGGSARSSNSVDCQEKLKRRRPNVKNS